MVVHRTHRGSHHHRLSPAASVELPTDLHEALLLPVILPPPLPPFFELRIRQKRSLLNSMSTTCPFAKVTAAGGTCPMKLTKPVAENNSETNEKNKKEDDGSLTVSPKCPYGYDSQTFKLGPLSCLICRALLYESSKTVPCAHKFCKVCILRFKDCPLCGGDIENVEPDIELQEIVDRFIEGHARIKRPSLCGDQTHDTKEHTHVKYEDVSIERGSFLVQQAMKAFHGQNIPSAKARLSLCTEDLREQIKVLGSTSELCSQLGAVLGMLGDCCRAMGDAVSAVNFFRESVEFLSKLSTADAEVVHTLSVSLNKIGDINYYDGGLPSARSYYSRSLDVRREALKDNPENTSQVIDVAVSLAKVADVDKSLGNNDLAVRGFQEAINCLESLTLNSNETVLEKRRISVLEFLHNQLSENQTNPAPELPK